MTLVTLLEGEPRASTRQIAEHLGVEHESVARMVSTYRADFQTLGDIRFEIGKPEEAAPGRPSHTYLLTEDQCYLLLTYSRNTAQARALKLALVQEFARLRSSPPAAPELPTDPISLALHASLELRQRQLRLEAEHAALSQRQAQIEAELASQPLNPLERGHVHRLGQELGRKRGSFGQVWRGFNAHFGIAAYHTLPRSRYGEAVQYLTALLAAFDAGDMFSGVSA